MDEVQEYGFRLEQVTGIRYGIVSLGIVTGIFIGNLIVILEKSRM
jgi:hypothetical protein